MDRKSIKNKLKRRGDDVYEKYFFNTPENINLIIEKLDNKLEITNEDFEVMFDCVRTTKDKKLELITYYPIKLKEYKLVTDEIIDEMYSKYGHTIKILKTKNNKIRSSLIKSVKNRSDENNLPFDLIAEDLIFPHKCPVLDIELDYSTNLVHSKNKPTIDKIIPELGYIKGNIQIISMLANQMKSNATNEELIKFAEYVIKHKGF